MNHFNVSVEVDNETGEVLAVYFKLRNGKSANIQEFGDGAAIADYDRHGRLIGIELLAPCSLRVINQITAKEPESRRFVKGVAPRKMVVA
jgi:hypothetical protein